MAARPRKQFSRRGPKREPYDRVLVVCEGERTEPLYFLDLAARYRLSMANIEVVGIGADPKSVVSKAKKLCSRENRHGEKFDKVYCVFDRDEHATFDAARDEAGASGVELATSWPCFEFWLRLHFGYSRHPYARAGGKSAAQNCVEDVKRWLPGYTKGADGVFGQLEERLEEAKGNAERASADAWATDDFNPSTDVHKLVDYLQSLKREDVGNGD